MRKSIVALAAMLAGAGSAHAQSSVTLYGVADVNAEYASHVGAVPTAANGFNPGPAHGVVRMDSGGYAGSRWGIRGTEDLGGGTSALFVLESGFNLDTGTLQQSGRLFGRQAFVGLASPYGQVTLGRQYTSMFEALANFVPMAYATQYEPVAFMAGANFREDNTVKYTGQFGPLTALAHWSFGTGLALPATVGVATPIGGNGEVPGQFRRDSAYGAALVYGAGPLAVTAGYDQFSPTIGTGSGTVKKASVGASYTFGPTLKVMGGYRWGQNKGQDGNLIQRDDYYWAGATYQATQAISLSVEYNYDNLKDLYGNTQLANPWQVALISDYAFSKRTDVYLTAAYAKNAGLTFDSVANVYATSLSLGTSYALANGQSSMLGVAVGVRHRF
ncbi:porin [Cupriavidus pauculus]|nr:porin [Cupriavidus pauculus]GJG95046.1 porin [Cupriavidus pauculus]